MQRHLLVVEDDAEIRTMIAETLVRSGYRVTALRDGRKLEALLDRGDLDLAVFDVMLPGENGLDLMRRVRARSPMGVILLSNMAEVTDRVAGLELGADDYLPKPFAPRELVARVRSLLRRMVRSAEPARRTDVYAFERWVLELPVRSLRDPAGAPVMLTSDEFALLEALVRQANCTVARQTLLQALAEGEATERDERGIEMRIARLRRKLQDDDGSPRLIQAVQGGGYVFAARVEVG